MIDLALLCNLYADGPTTLGRLKELGSESLEDVVALSSADLGWALQESSEACERFRREARLLRERRGPVVSAVPPSACGSSAAGPSSDVNSRATVAGSSTTGEPAVTGQREDEDGSPIDRRLAASAQRRGGESGRRDGSLLDVLLRAWRRASGRDDAEDASGAEAGAAARPAASAAVDGPNGTPAQPPRPEAQRHEFGRPVGGSPLPERRAADASALAPTIERRTEQRVELHAAPRRSEPSVGSTAAVNSAAVNSAPIDSATGPAAPFASMSSPGARTSSSMHGARTERVLRGTPLVQVGFEGVEADYARQLENLGIDTVEDFLASQPLDLAGRSSMRYTVLLRMQFVARRELERVP
jgi:hypothetical protein